MKSFNTIRSLLLCLVFVMCCKEPIAQIAPSSISDTSFLHLDLNKPRLKLIKLAKAADQLEEISGMIYWDSAIWCHNDSGNDPVLFKLNRNADSVLKAIQLLNVLNNDWEDMTQDEDHVYIGDFGNNWGGRENLKILVLEKASLLPDTAKAVEAKLIHFTYPGQESFLSRRNHNYDCEALISYGDHLWLFTKNRLNERTDIYRLPKTPGHAEAEWMSGFNSKGLITAADSDPSGRILALGGYTDHNYQPFLWVFSEPESGDHTLLGKRIELNPNKGNQMEALCFGTNGEIYLGSEKTPLLPQRIYTIPEAVLWDENLCAVMMTNEQPIRICLKPGKNGNHIIAFELFNAIKGTYVFEMIDSSGSAFHTGSFAVRKNKERVRIRIKPRIDGSALNKCMIQLNGFKVFIEKIVL